MVRSGGSPTLRNSSRRCTIPDLGSPSPPQASSGPTHIAEIQCKPHFPLTLSPCLFPSLPQRNTSIQHLSICYCFNEEEREKETTLSLHLLECELRYTKLSTGKSFHARGTSGLQYCVGESTCYNSSFNR